jgi:phosphate transport system permease protein
MASTDATVLLDGEPTQDRSLREKVGNARSRETKDKLGKAILTGGMVAAVIPLILILFEVARRGAGVFGWEFITQIEPPYRREGGGYLQGIVGTAYMVTYATLMSVPTGIAAAFYLVEYKGGKLGTVIRFFTDVMSGVPSVFVGLFIYSLLIREIGFGTLVGAMSLAIIMLPIVVRSSEEMLKLVPAEMRRASYALGARKWQTTMKVVLPAAGPGLVTGAFLAVARAAGETAPLLLTALGSMQVVHNLQGRAQSSITLLIYDGATQPFAAGQQRAWGGALLLLVFVVVFTVAARWVGRRGELDVVK